MTKIEGKTKKICKKQSGLQKIRNKLFQFKFRFRDIVINLICLVNPDILRR